MKSADEYYDELYDVGEVTLLSMFERIQIESYNQAINDCADNVKLLSTNKALLSRPYGWEEDEHADLISGTKCVVSKQSILKLKK